MWVSFFIRRLQDGAGHTAKQINTKNTKGKLLEHNAVHFMMLMNLCGRLNM
jgi:hypothetical protein